MPPRRATPKFAARAACSPFSPEQPVCVSFTILEAASLGGPIAATRELGARLVRALSADGCAPSHRSGEHEVFEIADLAGARATNIMGHIGRANEREQWRIHFVTNPDFFGLNSAQRFALDDLCQSVAAFTVAAEEIEDIDVLRAAL